MLAWGIYGEGRIMVERKYKKMLGIVWRCTLCNVRVDVCVRFAREGQGRKKDESEIMTWMYLLVWGICLWWRGSYDERNLTKVRNRVAMFYLEWTRWHSYALCTADFGVQLPVGEKPGRTERRKIDENYGMDIFVGVRNLWKGRSYDNVRNCVVMHFLQWTRWHLHALWKRRARKTEKKKQIGKLHARCAKKLLIKNAHMQNGFTQWDLVCCLIIFELKGSL